MADRIEAGNVDELAGGAMKLVDAERPMVLIKLGTDFFAIDDECTHSACSLSDGFLDGDVLECECHGSMFNVRTGAVEQGPAEEPIPTHSVEVEDDTVYVNPG